jgi:hypothetical protein
MTTIAGVVQKPVDAQRLIDELTRDCLCDRADISVLTRSPETSKATTTLKEGINEGVHAAKTIVDGLFQGFESVSRSIPGGGILRAFGSMGVTVVNAGVSTAGELAKALMDMGLSRGDARFYGEAFERGEMVVTVNARSDQIAQCARKVMMKYGAVAPESRAAA